MRVAFAGTPEFALPPLQALLDARLLVGVLTQPDRPAGRGRALAASPVKQLATAHGIPLAQPASLRSEAERAALQVWQPDLLVVVAYGLILPAAALSVPRLGCVNIHASLLPRWRGAAPIQRAILAGDAHTGVTLMRMEQGLDTGPMLLSQTLPIGSAMIAGELHDALARLGARLLLEALPGIADGSLAPRAQPADGVTYAAKLDKAEAAIQWRGDAAQIERQVRAFNPWPVAQTLWQSEPLRIWRARVVPANELDVSADGATPGTVLGIEGGALLVACGSGVLGITELQCPGRRVVSAVDFANSTTLRDERFGHTTKNS
ncbi:MAG: methionyl-tRNA formyltransferase [Steroidobacteraceae bacterium]